ncbi:MAG: hypothetical protein WCA20_18595 [Candidatus Sulfotelmatobacter sp.]
MRTIKSVGVLSLAKIMGLMYACRGLIFAPLFLLIGVLASAAGQHNNPVAGTSSIGFAVLFPVLYGVIRFIAGPIGAFYNLFARWVGGSELEMELCPKTLTAPYPIIPPASPASSS